MPRLADVVATLDVLYDPATAESWDSVGLVCGDPADDVTRVLLAVDPVEVVAEEAVASGAQLLVTHHPLWLRGTTSVAATSAKGRVVQRLVRAGVALHVVHTNGDVADPGVSDALADVLGLVDLTPLDPVPDGAYDKVVVFVPVADAGSVVDALADAGAGALGDYSRCAWTGTGTGTFRPGDGASPSVGRVGEVATVDEARVEMVLPRGRRTAVVRAMRAAHPYEEPAFDLFELAALPGTRGLGRVGDLPVPMSLRALTALAAARLPRTASGVRAGGDPDRVVRRVAVCGGSGDSLLGAARRAGADAYLSADLRHHPASEALADGGPALIDAAHWATEHPWLEVAGRRLRAALADTVSTQVSATVTDPWTLHHPSAAPPESPEEPPR